MFYAPARFLKKHIKYLENVSEKIITLSLIAAVLAILVGIMYPFIAKGNDTVAKGYIEKGTYGEPDSKENLEVSIDGISHSIDLDVPSRKYSDSEVLQKLDYAAAKIPDILFEDIDPHRVNQNLNLMTSIPGSNVSISWTTSNFKYMDWDGTIGADIPAEGVPVVITAELSLQDKVKNTSFDITVYPLLLSTDEALEKEVISAVSEGSDPSDDRITLPGKINGHTITWKKPKGNAAVLIILFGILFSVLLVLLQKQKISKERKHRADIMLLDYPNIINKLVLLLNAGLSMRGAIAKISLDYKSELNNGASTRWGYEEILAVYNEMNLGVSEYEAYKNLGRRAITAKYKTLSTLLLQNLMRGSRELVDILEREADEAFEERKKNARILGEEAGTKLLFPMIIMLGLVIIILVVPAFITMS